MHLSTRVMATSTYTRQAHGNQCLHQVGHGNQCLHQVGMVNSTAPGRHEGGKIPVTRDSVSQVGNVGLSKHDNLERKQCFAHA